MHVTTKEKIKKAFISAGKWLKNAFKSLAPADISLASAVTLVLIVALAVYVRITPILQYGIVLNEFDPWINYRNTRLIVERGPAAFFEWWGWYDTQTWAPEGHSFTSYLPGIPFTAAIGYWFVRAIGIPVDLYTFVVIFPVIGGVIGVISTYFLGREIGGNTTGLLSAFFLAWIPGYIQRTIAGFFDNESIGVALIVLVFLFFIRALKKDSIYNAIIAGLLLGYLGITWGGYDYPLDVIGITVFIYALLKRNYGHVLKHYTATIGIGMLIPLEVRCIGPERFIDVTYLGPIGVLVILALLSLYRAYGSRFSAFFTKPWRKIELVLVVGIVTTVVIYYIATAPEMVSIRGRFLILLNPEYRQQEHILGSVGEHMPSPWSELYFNLLPLTFMIPAGVYFLAKDMDAKNLLMLVAIATSVYFASAMVRTVLVLAPIAAVVGSYGLQRALTPIMEFFFTAPSEKTVHHIKKITGAPPSRAVGGAIVFMVSVVILVNMWYAGPAVLAYSQPSILEGGYDDWRETMAYLRFKLPSSATIASWWDYGYWIAVAGEKKSVVDNNTLNTIKIAWIGRVLTTENETEALEILKRYNATHFLVYWGGNAPPYFFYGLHDDLGKFIWPVRIAHDHITYAPGEEYFYNTSTYEPTDHFYQTVGYRMILYGEPVIYWQDRNNDGQVQSDEILTAAQVTGNNVEAYYLYKIALAQDAVWRTHPNAYPPVQPRLYKIISGTEAALDDWSKVASLLGAPEPVEPLKYFRLIFWSSHRTVRVFEIDYTYLETEIMVNSTEVYYNTTAGTWMLKLVVSNTGSHDLELSSVKVNGTLCTHAMGNEDIPIRENSTVYYYIPSAVALTSGTPVTVSITINPTDTSMRIDRVFAVNATAT